MHCIGLTRDYLYFHRTEKKSAEGELIQEKGWKPVGKGTLKLLKDDKVHFLEFRPIVSESSGTLNMYICMIICL